MKRIIWILILLVFICLCYLSALPGSLNPDWLPASSKWVLHFDQARFAGTRLYSLLDLKKAAQIGFPVEINRYLQVDFNRDVKSLTIAVFPKPDKQEKGDQIMVILQGKFDRNRIISKLKEKENKLKTRQLSGVTVYSWRNDSHLFFPVPGVLVFCESSTGPESIVNLHRGRNRGLPKTAALYKMLSEAPANAFVLAAAIDVSELARHAPRTMVLESSSLAFFMALEEKDLLNAMLKLATESAAKAANLQQVVTGLKALAAMKSTAEKKDNNDFDWQELLGSVRVGAEENRLVLSISYPVDKMAALLGGGKKPEKKN